MELPTAIRNGTTARGIRSILSGALRSTRSGRPGKDKQDGNGQKGERIVKVLKNHPASREYSPQFKHWVKQRRFQLVSYTALGLKDVLCLPAKTQVNIYAVEWGSECMMVMQSECLKLSNRGSLSPRIPMIPRSCRVGEGLHMLKNSLTSLGKFTAS